MISTRKILSFLILGTLVFEISRFYSFVENYSSWQYADWLINYEGGLVRRGFIGEILYLIHKLLLIDLDKIIFCFVSLICLFVCLFACLLVCLSACLFVCLFGCLFVS